MPDTTLEAIANQQAALIRKIQAASIFMAPATEAVPTSFTAGATAALQSLPTAYKPIGYVTKDDAYTWSREVDVAETTSHGVVDPTRRDIISVTSGLQFSAQETNKAVLEAFHNIDLSSVVPTATTGEVSFVDPLAPATRAVRLIAIGRDGIGANAVYIIRVMPRAILTGVDDQTWSDTDELVYPLTYSATPDGQLGYATRYVFAGPGWKSQLVTAGFPAAT